jgi:hypothetical protein
MPSRNGMIDLPLPVDVLEMSIAHFCNLQMLRGSVHVYTPSTFSISEEHLGHSGFLALSRRTSCLAELLISIL